MRAFDLVGAGTLVRSLARWSRGVGKYGAIARASLATQAVYLGEVAARTLFLAMILFIFLSLWQVTYAALGATAIAGLSLGQMVWYLLMTEVIVISRPRFTREIDAEVRSGDIAYQLTRPYSYVGYRLGHHLGDRLLRLGLGFATGVPLALLYVGPIAIDPVAAAIALAVLACGLLIDFAISMAIGLCAFWVEDTAPFSLLYDRLLMLLGGLILPIDLFPELVARVVAYLPFPLLLYAPARLIVTGDLGSIGTMSVQLVVTATVALWVLGVLFAVATRRLVANGG